MKSIKLILALTLLNVTSGLGQTTNKDQTTTINDYIKIPRGTEITKIVNVLTTDTLPIGSIVKRELQREHNGERYTVTIWDTISPGEKTKFQYEKKTPINLGYVDGKANLTLSEDKKTVRVNFWLIEETKISIGTKYKVLKRSVHKNTKFEIGMFDSMPFRTAKKDSMVRLNIVNIDKYNCLDEGWFQKSDIIIAVYEGSNIAYFLVNKYDRNGEYVIELDNRELLSTWRTRQIMGPVTVPLKYRSGFSLGDSIDVKNDFGTGTNLGVFYGGSTGRYRVRYEKDHFTELPEFSFVYGVFLNLSTVELDSLSTIAGRVPFKKEEKGRIGVLSSGIGLMYGMNNFNVGLFVGWDFGFGSDAKNWNFNNRMWLGLGISYSPTIFFKKE